jgi:hypothetical protein
MSYNKSGFVAVFKYLDHLTNAMEKTKGRAEFEGHEIFTPCPYHEIFHVLDYKPSAVRYFTFTGAMIGTVSGFGICLLMAYLWPITVGGKTAGIASLPAYVVIGFELTILLGGIATIIGMLVMGRIPNPKVKVLDTRFTDDHFGIFVPGASVDSEQAKLLKECGAIEINHVEGDS